MEWRDAQPLDRVAMLGSCIADVLRELPAGMRCVGASHVAIAGLLGDHRRRGDRRALGIPADHRSLFVADAGHRKPIAQAYTPRAADARQSIAQRSQIRDVEAVSVDPRRASRDDRDLGSDSKNHGIQLRAHRRGLLLGVVQRTERANLGGTDLFEVEQHTRGDQGPGEAAPAGFIGAGDEAEPEGAVEPEQTTAGPRRSLCPRLSLRGTRFGPAASM